MSHRRAAVYDLGIRIEAGGVNAEIPHNGGNGAVMCRIREIAETGRTSWFATEIHTSSAVDFVNELGFVRHASGDVAEIVEPLGHLAVR
ncbi:hypothetical protein [Paraliomyxa miuraensis]|uniref:hypothetical protein n=1 Tax=Paraliomyxa miuraensis TaxID=376150 RepID=UPI00225368C3|nr:hypothetical protein [Paraliomyxa miuraensis]MCX4240835.1 hypothetical protein [Paraliomyxa miuraensis]